MLHKAIRPRQLLHIAAPGRLVRQPDPLQVLAGRRLFSRRRQSRRKGLWQRRLGLMQPVVRLRLARQSAQSVLNIALQVADLGVNAVDPPSRPLVVETVMLARQHGPEGRPRLRLALLVGPVATNAAKVVIDQEDDVLVRPEVARPAPQFFVLGGQFPLA